MSNPIAKTIESFSTLFQKEEPRRGGRTTLSTDRPRTSLDASHQAQERLRSIWKERGKFGAGHIGALGLDKLRDEMGSDWERLSERVRRTAEDILSKRLSKTDMYVHQGELGYVVLFAELTGELAESKMVMIANEILERLFGDDRRAGTISISSCATDFNSNAVLENVDPFEVITNQLARAKKTELSLTGQSSSGVPTTQTATPAVQQSTLRHAEPPLPGEVEIQYRGIWDVKKRALLAYTCWPSVLRRADGTTAKIDPRTTDLDAEDIALIDQHVLRRAVESFGEMAERGTKFQIIAPVHFETLADPRQRRVMMAAYRDLPKDVIRYLTIELTHAPEGVPFSRLADICATIKSYASRIYYRFGHRRQAQLQGCGIQAAGFDLAAEDLSDAHAMQQFTAFAASVSAMGLRPYVYGLSKMSLITSAVCAGVEMISGDFVRPTKEKLFLAYRFDSEDLVSEFFKQVAR